jgi:plastocyanin
MFSKKALAFIALLASNVWAEKSLRSKNQVEHLEIELEVEGGERHLFPLLPGTKCPAGHKCFVRNSAPGVAASDSYVSQSSVGTMMGALKSNIKTPLAMSLNWEELGNNLDTVVGSNDYCTRRAAMARAAGITAGVAAATVSSPAYAAETKEVKMGSDSGGLQFIPAKTSICKGDSVKWINNKGGPHNVVFDEEAIPEGVDQEKISMDEQLGEEGDTFVMKFDVAGDYAYYCEPHRGAGMNGQLIVA